MRDGDELLDRLRGLVEGGLPGAAYTVRAPDAAAGRQLVRVALIGCPGCGGRLSYREERAGKFFDCHPPPACGQA